MGLLVLKAGLRTKVEGPPRVGLREFGVPPGGAFDLGSFRLANALLGNDLDAPALELTMIGGRYRAIVDLALALAGAPFAAEILAGDDTIRRLVVPQSFTLRAGECLVIGGTPQGLRAYLTARGGFDRKDDPSVTGSLLRADPGRVPARRPARASFESAGDAPIRLLDGPDGPVPPPLLTSPYRVGIASDRIGLRLEGGPIVVDLPADRPSAPVAAGAVQIAGGGPIVLGVDGGTMGGYPHVAHVASVDLDRIGQARPGDRLRFVRVGLDDARQLDRRRIAALRQRDIIVSTAAADGLRLSSAGL